MQHLFLADVHLGAFSQEKNKKLEKEVISIVEYCLRKKVQLHILGDLFDYWMEYPDYTPALGSSILDAFGRYNRQHSPATYITGNHDNWTFGHFDKNGFDVQTDYKRLSIHNIDILLHHGDGISDPDFNLPRPLFHRLLRNKYFIALYQSILLPEAGLDLMKQFSQMSREKSTVDPRYLNKWSEHFLTNTSTEVVISGHDHVPRKHVYPFGTYLNTGAFYDQKTMVYYNKGSFDLVSWNDEESRISPYINNPDNTQRQ